MKTSFSFLAASGLAAVLAAGALVCAQAPATGTGTGTRTPPARQPDRKPDQRPDRGTGAAAPAGRAAVGQPAPNFTLKTTDGKDWSLSDAAGKIVVLEWTNPDCPVCRRVMSDGTVATTIREVKSMSPDIVYIAINSTAADAENPAKTAAYLKDNKIDIVALIDGDGKVGKMYDARTTPHCFVIDQKGVLRYTGAIDDNKTGGGESTMNYVVNAVKQIKAGETVSPDTTKPYGCSVKYASRN